MASGLAQVPSSRDRQRGVALITVLLVFALVAVLAAAMLERAQLSQRSAANLIGSRQAWHYALGGEAYARQLLANDLREGERGVDLLTEAWARVDASQLFEIDAGEMTIEIADLQARFNLNNLVTGEGAPDAAQRAQLLRLLTVLGLDAKLADQWQDWIDPDREPLPAGGEDGAFSDLLAANRPEAHSSALRQMPSLSAEQYHRLAPFVTTLPAFVPVNVNTAPAEVLRALSPIIDDSTASRIISRQQRGGFATTQAFIDFVGAAATGLAGQVSVDSSYFEVTVTVNIGDYWQRLRTVLRRDNNAGAIHVVARERLSLSEEIRP